MTSPVWRWPDIHDVLIDLLEPFVGEGRVDTQTPDDLQSVMPFIRVTRTGGGNDRISDFPRVDVEVFAATYRQASDLAEDIRQFLIGQNHRVGPAVLDRASCDQGPVELPWADPGVRRIGATYTFSARRYRASS